MLNEIKINVDFSEVYIMADFGVGFRKAIGVLFSLGKKYIFKI